MDIPVTPKKGIKRKHLPWIAGGILLSALVGWIVFGKYHSVLKVDRRILNIATAEKTNFDDYILSLIHI